MQADMEKQKGSPPQSVGDFQLRGQANAGASVAPLSPEQMAALDPKIRAMYEQIQQQQGKQLEYHKSENRTHVLRARRCNSRSASKTARRKSTISEPRRRADAETG